MSSVGSLHSCSYSGCGVCAVCVCVRNVWVLGVCGVSALVCNLLVFVCHADQIHVHVHVHVHVRSNQIKIRPGTF